MKKIFNFQASGVLAVRLLTLLMVLATISCATSGGKGSETVTTSAQGFGGSITVTLTLEEGRITAISAVGPDETPGIGSRAIEQLPGIIAAKGSLDVDVIAGASITSNAIIIAARQGVNELTGAKVATAKMKPGTYTASAYGFMGIEPLTVHLTVSTDKIEKLEIDRGRESVPMINAINKLMVPRILQYQSLAVDTITGATASGSAVLQAAREALTEALKAGDSSPMAITAFLTPEPKISRSETINVDVLVVGMGGSGCAAAMSAAEAQHRINPNAVSVLAVDKAGKFGGTSAFCGEPMAVNAPKYKAQFNQGQDYMDKNALLQAWAEYTEGDAKMDIVNMYLDNSGDTIDWLFYEHGFLFNNPLTGFGPDDVYRCKYQYVNIANKEPGRDYGRNVDRSMNEMVDSYFHQLIADYESLGGKYMLETEVQSLIYDSTGAAVTGAIARGHDGTEYTINAKAVILASGGFGGNKEMETEFFSQNPYYKDLGGYWELIGMTHNTGKMIQSAINIGAGTYNIDMVPMVHFATSNMIIHDYPTIEVDPAKGGYHMWYGTPSTWSKNDVPNGLILSNQIPWVNKHGERFVMEGQLFSWWIAGPSYWAVWSQNLIDDLARKGFLDSTMTYARGSHGGMQGNVPVPEIYDIVQKAIDLGFMVKADTIQELAEKMGVPPASLARTISDYNGFAAAGRDAQFNKKADRLLPLSQGPFYAIKGYSAAFSTVGGLDINTRFNVLKKDGQTPIRGLYAVGNESGGVLYSDKKPYVTYGGAALGWAFTSGRLAGGFAAEYAGAD
jgi:fumarate reductase flavoprotein subunit